MMIPQVIVQYWDQEVIPDDVASLMESWKSVNSRFEYKLFDKSHARSFLSNQFGPEGLEVFDAANVPAMRSDIFRVAYILCFGGIYIDAATRAVSNIAELIGSDDRLYLMRKWHGGVWNGFMAAPPRHPKVQKIWDRIRRNVDERNSNDVWAVTGPGVFNELIDGYPISPESVSVSKQTELKKFFLLVNDLDHKKNNHWSEVQKEGSIFVENLEEIDQKEKSKAGNDFQSIILHFGPHKTGTTSFQNLLENNESLINKAGFSLVTVRSKNSERYKAWRVEYTKVLQGYLLGKTDRPKAFGALKGLFLDLESVCSPSGHWGLIVSDENLLGPVPGHRYAGGLGREKSFYTAHELVFSAASEAFQDKELKPLLCKRDFGGFITSTYRDFVFKLNTSESPKKFLGGLNQTIRSDYQRFYRQFEVHFSDEGEIIQFQNFMTSMLEIISNKTGVAIPDVNVTSNKSPDWRAVELALAISPFLESDAERSQFSRFLSSKIKGENAALEEEMNSSLAKLR